MLTKQEFDYEFREIALKIFPMKWFTMTMSFENMRDAMWSRYLIDVHPRWSAPAQANVVIHKNCLGCGTPIGLPDPCDVFNTWRNPAAFGDLCDECWVAETKEKHNL